MDDLNEQIEKLMKEKAILERKINSNKDKLASNKMVSNEDNSKIKSLQIRYQQYKKRSEEYGKKVKET